MGPASPRPAGQHQADRGGEAHDDYNDNDNNDDGTDEAGEPRSEHGEGLLILDLRHHYRTWSRLTGSPRSWGPTPGVSTAAWAVTWGLRSIGHSQLHTGPLPLPKPAMSSISVFIHMSGGERAHLQPQCGGGEAHHQPEEIRPVLAVRVSQWDP